MRYTMFILSALWALTTTAQTSNTGKLMRLKTGDGLRIVTVQLPSEQMSTVTLFVRYGVTYDSDSLSGISYLLNNILAEKCRLGLAGGKYGINTNTAFTTEHGIDVSYYQFIVPNDKVAAAMKLILDSISKSEIGTQELIMAKIRAESKLAADKENNAYKYNEAVTRKLFAYDFYKRWPYGNPARYVNIDTAHINAYHRKYYTNANALLSIAGSLNADKIAEAVKSSTGGWNPSPYDPESITKIIDFKPMINSTRMVVNSDNNNTEFNIYYQLPGIIKNPRMSYCAFLVTEMLNDNYNYIHAKGKKLGMRDMNAQYLHENFSSVFVVTVKVNADSSMFTVLDFVTKELARIDKMLLNESSLNAGKVQFANSYDGWSKSTQGIYNTIKYTTTGNDEYWTTLRDSVMKITEKQMRPFIEEFFVQAATVTTLSINEDVRKSQNIDSVFTNIDRDVDSIVFNFRTNVHDLEGPENSAKLNRLVQWLKINPDLTVQVNGYSDKSEYNKATDDSIIAFIDSLPDFRKVKQDIIVKKALRLEMMRAIKIVRYLYEHGISADRLRGSSMSLSSTNRQEALANMKCDLTIEKHKLRLSLYEYHYGKPKPTE